MPHFPGTADTIGWLIGANLDAETPMKKIIERNIAVTVLCHERDPVIPKGARMAEFVEPFSKKDNVTLIRSEFGWEHAQLSQEMIDQLSEKTQASR